jgi:hypothetical protein
MRDQPIEPTVQHVREKKDASKMRDQPVEPTVQHGREKKDARCGVNHYLFFPYFPAFLGIFLAYLLE